MDCPVCGGTTGVYDTRHSSDSVARRRKCDWCGKTFATVEIDRDYYTQLSPMDKAAVRKKIDAAMETIKGILYKLLQI